jgi:tetratricopeptide (TPR) repeat protein
MKQFYILFAFLLSTLAGLGQANIDLDITTKDYTTGKKVTGVSIDIYDGANIIKSIVTPSNGNVRFNIPAGKKYKIEFSKAGKVTRFAYIDGKGIDPELLQGGSSAKAKLEVSLFDQVPTIDYSYVEKNPFTEYYFDGTSPELQYDDVLREKMAKKIAALVEQSEKAANDVEAKYQDAMSKAAEWENKKMYKEALAKYEEALLIKPKDKDATDKVKEMDFLLKQQQQGDQAAKQKEEEYKKLVATADALRDQGKYAEAVAKYQEALKIKDEQYAKDQITKANKIIADQKAAAENEGKYKKAIDAGETLFSQKKYTDAKASFTEALKYKPNDPVATKRLQEIDVKIKEEEALAGKKKLYDAKIAEAEQLLASNKLVEAKAKFSEALTIDNTQTYPTTKIKEIDAKLADAEKNKQKKEKYDAAMKAADQLFAANKLAEAKAKYQEAASIDNTQSKPAENIQKIDKMLADQETAKREKEKADKIALLMKDALALYSKNDLENAKKKYQEVLSLDGNNAEANSKINEINNKIAANQSEAEKTKKFNELKTEGISLMSQKKWSDAKRVLNEARGLKADPDIDAKLKEIEAKIAEENAKLSADQAYNKLIEEAKGLEASNIDGAIAKYREAQKMKPNDPVPPAKIKELEAKKTNASAAAETDKKYAEAMKKGKDAMAAENYSDAIKFFNEAGKIKPSETEPAIKAKEAEALSVKKSQSEEDRNYEKILTAGQKAMDEKNWTKAKELYNRALTFRPTDIIPKNKLKEIDDLMKAEEEAKKGTADKENAFRNKMAEAESAVKVKDYDKAIRLFEEAKVLKATDPQPAKRIEDVKALRDKESASAQNDKLYQEYMSSGVSAMNSKNYTQALSEFKNALNVKKNDKAALAKIDEVQQLIDNESNNKTAAEFNQLIKEADAMFALKTQKGYIDAKNLYGKALNIKGNDAYAQKQFKRCAEELEKIDDGDREYRKILDKADENFQNKKYDKAIELYKRAKGFRPSDSYPQEKLDEIDAILNPAVTKTIGPLNALGIPTTDDPNKANAELVKAEESRKQLRKRNVEVKSQKTQDNNTVLTDKKTEAIYNQNNQVSEIVQKNAKNYREGDENRQETVETVEKSKTSMSNNANESTTVKYNENLNNRENISTITSEVSAEQTQKIAVYTDNTETVKAVSKRYDDKAIVDKNQAYSNNITNRGELEKTQVKIDDQNNDDYEERKQIDDQVKDINAKINKNDDFNVSKESDNILNVATKIETEEKVRSAKEVADSKTPYNNGLEVDQVDNKLSKNAAEQGLEHIEKSLKSDGEIAAKNKVIALIPEQQDANRKNNVDIVQKEAHTIQDKSREEYNQNVVKHLTNQGSISSTVKSAGELADTKVADAKKIAADVDRMDKSANSSHIEKGLNDDQQRANTKTDVNNTMISTSKENTQKATKVDENIDGVKNVSTSAGDQKYQSDLNKKTALENAQVNLNKISSKELKFDDKVANELGSIYPEGVSQEVFNQDDENGLLIAVVTRRVVVKNGYGQVYIRTQSLTGITYSKNGEPSNEHIWQKETQDSKLKRNY